MFYISSQGHSASSWLSRALNVHQKIVCWHGLRSIPPYKTSNEYYRNFSPKEFVNGLEACEKNTYGEKIFGAIHGFYGIAMKQEIEKKGGNFFAIFRHPYAKINSIFSALYPKVLTSGAVEADKIKIDSSNLLKELSEEINNKYKEYKKYKNRKIKTKKFLEKFKLLNQAKSARSFYYNVKNKVKKNKKKDFSYNNSSIDINSFSIKEKTNSAFDTFLHACSRTFETDAELIKNCNLNQFFVMEKFVSSDKYFSMMFKKITNMELNKNQLSYIFSGFSNDNHRSDHAIKKKNNEIYESWPQGFKNIVEDYLSNEKIREFYNKLDYHL